MSFVPFVRALDARAIGIAFVIAYLAYIPLGLLFGALGYSATSDPSFSLDVQGRFVLVAWFAAPFVGSAIAARLARQLPLVNGVVVAAVGTLLQLSLMSVDWLWGPPLMLAVGLVAGLVGALIGRRMRPTRNDI